jgi:hypothetical protein
MAALDGMLVNFPQDASDLLRKSPAMNGLSLTRRIWRRTIDDNTLEAFTMQRKREQAVMNGVIVAIECGEPVLVEYELHCEASLREARSVRVRRTWREETTEVALVREGDVWSVNGQAASTLASASDIDIEWTPATNAIPIARLGSQPGAMLEMRAAWIRLPGMTVEASRQRYTRLMRRRCRYENLDSGFTADIEIDDEGLPITYGAIWSCPAAWSSSLTSPPS